MKVRNVRLICVSLLLLVIASLSIYTQVSMAKNETDDSFSRLSQEQHEVAPKKLNDFQECLNREGGFFKQVEEKLKGKGYAYYLLGMFYAKD